MSSMRFILCVCGTLLSAAVGFASPAMLYQMDQTPVFGNNQIVDAANSNSSYWGTIVGSTLPALTNGARAYTSNAWQFSAKSCISVANNIISSLGDITNTPGLTIGFWFNWPNAVGYDSICTIGQTYGYYAVTVGYDNYQNVTFSFGDNKIMPQVQISTGGINPRDGNWHHLVATMDFRRSSNNLCLYQDGVLHNAFTKIPATSFNYPGVPLQIGSPGFMNGYYHYFNGKLDQFIVCTNALSAAEAQQLYTTGVITNYAPIVMARADQTAVIWPSNMVNLSASISDDGLPSPPGVVTNLWTKMSGPGTVTFGTPTTNATTATFSAPGEYLLRCTAGDGQLTDYDEVLVRVVANQPPDIAAWVSQGQGVAQSITLLGTNSATVSLGGWVQDDGLPSPPGVTTSWWTQAGGPASVSFANAAAINTTATIPTNIGVYQLQLNATDTALSNFTTVLITVVSNLAPTVSAWAVQPLLQWPSNVFSLQAIISDDGFPKAPGVVTSCWSQISGPLTASGTVAFGSQSAPNTSATCSLPGIYQLELVVSDGLLYATNDVWVNIWSNNIGVLPPPSMRQLSATPPPYQHPRVLVTEADRSNLQARAGSDSVVQDGLYGSDGLFADVAGSIDNPSSLAGNVYASLAAGNNTVDTSSEVQNANFYGHLANACYLAWLWPTNALRLQQLATAVGTAASAQSRWYTTGQYDGLGLAYDFIYNWMSPAQRNVTRALISQMYTNVHSYAWGLPTYNRQNWITEGMSLVMSDLAIEGETGFDAQTTADLRTQMRNYSTQWGIMEQGFTGEGMGYYGFGMGLGGAQASVALARRQDNIFVTTRLYQSMIEAFYQMPPWLGGNMFGHQDQAGWSGSAQATIYFVEKYMFPDDPMVDLVFRNALLTGSQDQIGLYKAIFGVAPSTVYTNYAVTAAASGLWLTKFDPQRGLGTARSDWSTNAVQLDFDCRFDTFGTGHMHTDRNNFDVWANGRTWIGDPGYHITENDAHSTVLIDGLGESGTSIEPEWPSLSGKVVEVRDQPGMALFSGDASIAYSYTEINNDPTATQGVTIPVRWVDCWYNAPAALYGDDQLMTNYLHVNPTPYNPVQRAFRSALLIRGTKPYVLVVDDIQKDTLPHTYTWSANTIGCDNIKDMAMLAGADATNAVFYHTNDTGAFQPRMLVRVLNATGTRPPIQLTNYVDGLGDQNICIAITASNTVAPDFKVLLFPHLNGDAMPTTTLSNNLLTVTMSDGQSDHIYFTPNTDGRTRIATYRVAGTNSVLGPVSGLSATGAVAQVMLAWSPSVGALGYTVSSATVSGGPYTVIASNVMGAAYTNSGLVNGVPYYYVVSALNANGGGEPSSQVTATPNVAGHVPANLTWIGDGLANVWDNQDSGNLVWLNGLNPTVFFNGDMVTFNDTGSNSPPITLIGRLAPSSNVVVNAAQNFTFSGSGGITGAAGLVKNGAGVLNLLTSNDYTGTNMITSGLVHVGNGGTNGGLGGGGILLNGGGLILDRSDSTTLSNLLSGSGPLTVQGGGLVTWAGNNAAYSGNLTVNPGTLAMGPFSVIGTGPITVNGGTLCGAYANMNAIAGLTLTNGGVLTDADSANVNFTRPLALAGGGGVINNSNTLVIQSVVTGPGTLTKIGAGTLVLDTNNTYSGTTIVNAGTLSVDNGGGTGMAPTNIVLNGGNLLVNRTNAYSQNGFVVCANPNSTFFNTSTSGPVTLTLADGLNNFSNLNPVSTKGPLVLAGSPRSTNVFNGNLSINGGAALIFSGGSYQFPNTGFGNSGQSGKGSCVVSNGASVYLANGTWNDWTNILVTGSNSIYMVNGTLMFNGNNGVVTLASNGTVLTANGAVNVGTYYSASYNGYQQSVTVNQSGGNMLLTGNKALNMGGAAPNYTTIYNMSGGTLSALGGTSASLTLGADTGGVGVTRFTLTGSGKVLVNGTISGSQSSGTPRQIFDFSGGTLAAGAITTSWLSSTNAPTAYGTLINNGGALAPGDVGVAGKTTITGNYAVSNAAAALGIDLGGTSQANAFTNASGYYDYVSISGSAALNGNLNVSLVNGFSNTVTPANSFTILSANGGIAGAFANLIPGGRVYVAGDPTRSFAVTINSNAPGSVLLGGYGLLRAGFTFTPTNGGAPLAVTFTDTSVSTAGITNRLWDFGDGLTTNTTATSVIHTYTSAAANLVTLTVSGALGLNAASQFVVVTNQPPRFSGVFLAGSNFILSGTSGFSGLGYYLLTSTNLNLPFSNWSFLVTNQFRADGSFGFTNAVDPQRPNGSTNSASHDLRPYQMGE